MAEELRHLVKRIIDAGYVLSNDGLEYLRKLNLKDAEEVVDSVISKLKLSSGSQFIVNYELMQKTYEEKKRTGETLSPKIQRKAIASEYEADVKILEEGETEPKSSVEGFVDYFRDRFKKIERLLRERIDVKDATSINQALEAPVKAQLKIIGMVTRKTLTGANLILELEDLTNAITILVSDQEIVKNCQIILQDQVVCAAITKVSKDLFILNDIILPDTPIKTAKQSEIPFCSVFLSDLHVGSLLFTDKLFEKFVKLIKGEIGPISLRKLSSRVKYVAINGDVVDGIGVYPEQQKELEITDVYKQYEKTASLFANLPDYLEIIVTPGNHDAVRRALPQPPILKEYAESLYLDERILMLGNPSRFSLNGVEVLLYHGKSLDDVLSQTPGQNFKNPAKGAELLLKSRHLAPIYGASTPLAPEKEDRMVISSIPDVLVTGHIHVFDSRRYKGVTILSAAPWQNQTSYQKRIGLKPTPGIVSIYDLNNNLLYNIDLMNL
ncbi:DNA-directed DNA polymerase II small subunit [Candidatus Bathyarchaeota archaeon]|nr:DNA-directed DNA polymerase II small subunit [Candidatus Bathyarchaeota archaeon]MBS7630779.1 DNA-directed DNA polymerase II small subunit [Candidatus Bathyarchaeota archaeon]